MAPPSDIEALEELLAALNDILEAELLEIAEELINGLGYDPSEEQE